MIRYSLNCPEHHRFDSWFQSAGAFDALADAGHLNCPVCGSNRIEKALMAPAVLPARAEAPDPRTPDPRGPDARTPDLLAPADRREAALTALRREIEQNADYVGDSFAAEARAMHEGAAPGRAIYGEARPEDARKLLEEGIPVAPLPFLPMRKVN